MATAVSSLLALVPDPTQRRRFSGLEPGAGLILHLCSSIAEADQLAPRLAPDVLVAGCGAGSLWLAQARARDPDAYRILCVEQGRIDEAVETVNRGEADAVLREPFTEHEVIALLHHGCEQALLRRHTRSLVDELAVRNAELLGFNERLEDLVAERTRHLVEAQERLQESQRQMLQLETQSTVSHLLRGLAHELNNPLAAIFGYAQRLRRQLDADADASRRLDVILQEVEHCHTVVQQLRQLATPLSEQVVRVKPEAALRDGLARLAATGRQGPHLIADEGLPDVLAAPRALARVCEQILANAADAGARCLSLRGETMGERVRLLLINDGDTPDETTVANAVRPFFTTRAGEDRRGLGLSTAAALLREQDGTIELTARDGVRGAMVIIQLPAADPGTRSGGHQLLPSIPPPTASGSHAIPTTLIIDDEPMVAELLVDALRDSGATTATAGSIAEGLAMLARRDVRALVVDLNLPDGSGLELVRRALELRPSLAGHIALTTGDSDQLRLQQLSSEHGLPVLAKPFRLDEVRQLAERLK